MIVSNEKGFIERLILAGGEFLFDGSGPEVVSEASGDLQSHIEIEETQNAIRLSISVSNIGACDINTRISVNMGIDSCMGEYPEWNYKVFPTMLRCEKTHFFGYLMSPLGKIMGLVCDEPIASYKILYEGKENIVSSFALDLINPAVLPSHYPDGLKSLKIGESIERTIYLFSADSFDDLYKKYALYTSAPFIQTDKWTLELGDIIDIKREINTEYQIYSPSQLILKNGDMAEEYGIYTVYAKRDDYISESYIYCRKSWDFYLREARKRALDIPQKATTHTESWYGFFSAYLAAKHYPDEALDKELDKKFWQLTPYIFDFDLGEPKVITERIQNVACMISLLADRFEADPVKNRDSLDIADRLFHFLELRQAKSGEYLRVTKHYTCVIYIAKSVLELYLAVKDIKGLEQRAQKYFASAKRAIDNLSELLDNISTEGVTNFYEDGMISCSALQLAMFALLADENDRQKYIDAARLMMDKHLCLEQKNIPDCRMRGGSLRWWESQYDILTKPNMMNSPHGWTAWTMYAKYYLYMLTGEVDYLKDLMNGMGACVQLMDLDGTLRWAFICDPYVEASVFTKDKKLKNGYSGRHEKRLIGEQYMDMISSWYTHEEQVPTGGYLGCPLFLKDKTIEVDNQGGCCDNDVHEIFKCLEECVLKKSFVHKFADGKALCYGASLLDDTISTDKQSKVLSLYSENDSEFLVNGRRVAVTARKLTLIDL